MSALPPPDRLTALRSRCVFTGRSFQPAALHISHGRITRCSSWDDVPPPPDHWDAGDLLVMPGLVDPHVHVNEPGRTEWEGFVTATRAAAAGGLTTLCDMPLNSIPATTTALALEEKRAAALGKTAIPVQFIGGLIPGNTGELAALKAGGACAFKCFLAPSGVAEFPPVGEAELRQAFPVLARLGLPLMVHAEHPAHLTPAGAERGYQAYLASRPPEAEHAAIALLIRLLEWCPTPVHIVHLSSASSLETIAAARTRGLPLTVETCPHYLSFAAEEIPAGATEFKCAPPIRNTREREGLWSGLLSGAIDFVASDHSPCPPALKDSAGDFFAAWGGIASLELSLPAVWTGARARRAGPELLVEWLSAAPARLVGLGSRKARLAAGYDADLVVWDPEARFVVDPALLHQRHKLTPYAGRTLSGLVQATYVAGNLVYAAPRGTWRPADSRTPASAL